MIVDVYVRNSTSKQVDNYNAEYQKTVIPEIVRKHGYDPHIYEEQGTSGEFLDNRKVMMAILERIRRHETSGIACVKLDRLSRDEDLVDGLEIWQICKKAGAVVITPDKLFKPGDPADDDYAFVNFWFAGKEKKAILTRMYNGMVMRAKAYPMFRGRVQYGYRPTLVTVNGKEFRTLEIDPDRAEVVREMFRLAATHGHHKIAMIFNERAQTDPKWAWYGFKNRKGLWQEQVVKRLLLEIPLYRGDVINFGTTVSRLTRDIDPIVTRMEHLRIVPEETYEAVHAIIRGRTIHRAKGRMLKATFSSLVRCPKCGASMMANKRKHTHPTYDRIYLYGCSRSYHFGKHECPGLNLTSSSIFEAIYPVVEEQLQALSSETLEQQVRQILIDRDVEIRALKERRKSKQAGYDMMIDMMADGSMSRSLGADKLKATEQAIRDLDRQIERLQAQKETKMMPSVLEDLRFLTTNLRAVLEAETPEGLGNILRAIFRSVVVDRDERNPGRGRVRAWVKSYELVEELTTDYTSMNMDSTSVILSFMDVLSLARTLKGLLAA